MEIISSLQFSVIIVLHELFPENVIYIEKKGNVRIVIVSLFRGDTMIKVSYLVSIIFVAITFLTGCATERAISPTISGTPRTYLVLSPAIFGSVYDGRMSQMPKDAAATLQADLSRIYGSSIEWADYFKKTPAGRVSIRIRIVTLGSSFGSRLVSSVAFANSVGSAQVSAIGPWGPVVGSVSSEQSVFAGSFSGEGWWNGAAWLDLEVQDNRGQNPITFTIPIVAEHRESNIWGYTSGDKAASMAWESVGVQLTRALDAIARIVLDHQ